MGISSKSKRFVLSNLNQVLRADEHYMATKDLKTQLANLQLRDGNALDGAVLLSSEFSDASLGHIWHVIVEALPDGECPPMFGTFANDHHRSSLHLCLIAFLVMMIISSRKIVEETENW